jgi:hypothetical protein
MIAMVRLSGLVVACSAAVAAAAPVPTHLIPPTPPYYYPTTAGTKLVYERAGELETRLIDSVEDKDGGKLVTVVTLKEDGTKSPFHKALVNAKGTFFLERAGRPYPAPFEMLRLPFKADTTWTEVEGVNGYGTRKAIREERMKEAAGEFDCVKIISEAPGTTTSTHWYARGIGVVKVDYGTYTLELKSITLPKR